MLDRRHLFAISAGAVLPPGAVNAQTAPSAAIRMNELGPENQALAQRTGIWDVTETLWNQPNAAPVSTTGLIAERRMIGSILQEILRPASDASDVAIKRIDYITFNRVVGRWDYVSMDTRAPVGIMPATSFAREADGRIVLIFQSGARAGAGPDVTGQMYRMQQVITHQGPERDVKDQHFIMADGTGTMWLAHQYAYMRRSS